MTFMSKEARTVSDHLDALGIEVDLGHGLWDLEVVCSQFFPNHIIGVIDKVLKGKDVRKTLIKLEKAQEIGWPYFDKPVRDFLTRRRSAHYDSSPSLSLLTDWSDWSRKCYSIVTSTYLVHDMNRDEANDLVFKIPRFAPNRQALMDGVLAAKRQRVRSVSYLRGIVSRDHAQRQARAKERKDEEATTPFEPPAIDVPDPSAFAEEWHTQRKVQRALREIRNAKDS